MEKVKFDSLKIGDTFFITTGDYNRIAQCHKINETTAQEIFGEKLVFGEDDLIMIENKV